ncbi:SDR family NAD(P)-dependent oxidoreductase [Chryseotalea sanaruensis]|uniref:SDR family NAD(P)-dependent oxidoreductase n=1 Tax=Chryseotalea sanaruensis TaxID=2482724 RepID=A0A401UCQ0_9BACT|nr:SDR family oxidoreductase [Chryseotalea sanaruensis]GCC52664.1 SDR family NAD(P)-dependent oxidoreductase [Chryseotalea sanaruensis]
MEGKVILVTGANKGIGFEIVRQLAKLGHEVLLATRDEQKGREALIELQKENITAHIIRLDIIDEGSIKAAVSQVQQQFGKLDVLINNAAILLKEDQSLLKNNWLTIDQSLQTDAMAQLMVTRHFQSLFTKGSRIIMTSSGGGSMSDPVGGWSPAYCIAKSLLNAITRHLAYEYTQQQISVNAFCPGWVKTDMGGKSAPRSVQQGADTAVWLATAEKIPTGQFFRDRKEIPW